MSVTDKKERATMAKERAVYEAEYNLESLRLTRQEIDERIELERKRALSNKRGLIRAGPMIQSALGCEDTIFKARTYNPRLNDRGYRQFYGKM
jgi:hypothetical protein